MIKGEVAARIGGMLDRAYDKAEAKAKAQAKAKAEMRKAISETAAYVDRTRPPVKQQWARMTGPLKPEEIDRFIKMVNGSPLSATAIADKMQRCFSSIQPKLHKRGLVYCRKTKTVQKAEVEK